LIGGRSALVRKRFWETGFRNRFLRWAFSTLLDAACQLQLAYVLQMHRNPALHGKLRTDANQVLATKRVLKTNV
jgi:hypothetical protein